MFPSYFYTLELLATPKLGVARYWDLLDVYGSVRGVIHADPKELERRVGLELAGNISKIEAKGCEKAQKAFAWCENNHVSMLCHEDPAYPSLLREVHRRPPLLYVKGDLNCLDMPQIAIVGSRSSSQVGKKNAFQFAAALASSGVCVTSGLALGIDTQAHEGALKQGGKTLAVVGTGIDRVYPARNRTLFERIVAEGGAIVSEFPLNTPPMANNFPRRNRIISGLSYGTLVIEAAIKSGSLITARYALEQNREVFAIPGSIHNPLSKGCHALIKSGATLVECATDIIEHLAGFAGCHLPPAAKGHDDDSPKKHSGFDFTEQERAVFELIEYDPVSLEYLAEKVQINIGDLLSLLMSLELKGIISHNALGVTRTE